MFQRILVPVDGSLRSEEALPVAAKLARASGGTVALMRAMRTPMAAVFPLGPTSVDAYVLAEETRAATAYLTRLADLPVFTGVETKTIVMTGSAVAMILDAALNENCDSIIMTTHGRTGLGRWALGSVARAASRWAPVPVLLLRSFGNSPLPLFDPQSVSGHGVLVPLDGSPLAEIAIEPAISLAQAIAQPGRGAIHLLLALWPTEAQPDNMPDSLALSGAQTYLRALTERLQTSGNAPQVTWSVVSEFDPASAILHVADGTEPHAGQTGGATLSQQNQLGEVASGGMANDGGAASKGYQAIALASHGRTGPNLWLMGSMAERVLDATHLPVLIAHMPVDRPSSEQKD